MLRTSACASFSRQALSFRYATSSRLVWNPFSMSTAGALGWARTYSPGLARMGVQRMAGATPFTCARMALAVSYRSPWRCREDSQTGLPWLRWRCGTAHPGTRRPRPARRSFWFPWPVPPVSHLLHFLYMKSISYRQCAVS